MDMNKKKLPIMWQLFLFLSTLCQALSNLLNGEGTV